MVEREAHDAELVPRWVKAAVRECKIAMMADDVSVGYVGGRCEDDAKRSVRHYNQICPRTT